MQKAAPNYSSLPGRKERQPDGRKPHWLVNDEPQARTRGDELVLRKRREGRSRQRSRTPFSHNSFEQRRQVSRSPSRYRGREQDERRSIETYEVNVIKETRVKPSGSAPPRVNGVWDPGHSRDLTVHMSLEITDDLEEELEQFCHLYKTGSFLEAHSFFDESLADYMHKPHVFAMYATMLLRQGSYHEICELDEDLMRAIPEEVAKQTYVRTLMDFWDLALSVARFKIKHPVHGLRRKIDDLANDLRQLITEKVKERNTIGSIEISMFHLLTATRNIILNSDATYNPVSFLYDGSRRSDNSLLKRIYDELLQEGRVWDMNDLLGALWNFENPSYLVRSITGLSFIQGISKIVKDWRSAAEQDVVTTMALLDLLMLEAVTCLEMMILDQLDEILEHATPLAISLLRHDGAQPKSRGYTQWIIVKACSIALQDPTIRRYKSQLDSFPGVAVKVGHFEAYIPINSENPGWHRPEAAPHIANAIKLAINTARELGDYRTEALGLKYLIKFTDNPVNEFQELCELHRRVGGDMSEYLLSLICTYLVSSSEESKSRLKEDLRERIQSPAFDAIHSRDRIWMANMLFYALERDGPLAEQAIKAADDCSNYLSPGLLDAIEAKNPDFYPQVDQRRAARKSQSKIGGIEADQLKLDEAKRKVDETQNTIKLAQLALDARRKEIDAKQKQAELVPEKSSISKGYPNPDESGLIMQPQFSDRKKIAVKIEDVDVDEDGKEIIYQPEGPSQPSSSAQQHNAGARMRQPDAIFLAPQNDGVGFERRGVYLTPDSPKMSNKGEAGRGDDMFSSSAIREKSSTSASQQGDFETDGIGQSEQARFTEDIGSFKTQRIKLVKQSPKLASSPESNAIILHPSRSLRSAGLKPILTHTVSEPPPNAISSIQPTFSRSSAGVRRRSGSMVLDENKTPKTSSQEYGLVPDRLVSQERRSSNSSNGRTQIADNDREAETSSPDRWDEFAILVDKSSSREASRDVSREASIEAASRRSTMTTVEDDVEDDEDIYN